MYRITLTIGLLVFAWISVQGQQTAEEKLRNAFTEAIANKQTIGLAGGYAEGGEIRMTYSDGLAILEDEIPFTENTPVRIASITKPITAIAIMQLVEAGKIDLSASVASYLPEFETPELKAIKVIHILQHSSGIGAYKNKKEAANTVNYESLSAALEIFIDRELQFEPGTDFGYTSYGYVILGMLIEKQSGLSYEAYLKANIFEPLGMDSTYLERSVDYKENEALVYHARRPGKISLIDDNSLSDRFPGGGLRSTVTDLLKFGMGVLNYSLVSKETHELMITNTGLKKEGNPYGLGWYLYGGSEPYWQIFGHNGAQYGCSSFLFLFPDTNRVTVVLSNTSRFEKVGDLAIQFYQIAKERSK